MKIFVTGPQTGENQLVFESFFPPHVREKLETLGEVYYNERGHYLSKEEMIELIPDVDVLFTGWDTPMLDEDILDAAKNLKVIAHTGGTTALVDPSAYDRGITVLSGNTIYAESVAESVIAYALTALRRIPDYLEETKKGNWNENINVWEGLLDQKIGIVGYGMTSRYLVDLLKPFRPEILVYSSHISDEELAEKNMKRASLEEIFSECKIVTIHSAMKEKNRHMINRELLEMLSPEALLINTARGGLIDEEVMVELLSENRFRAVLDVFEVEPLPVPHALRELPNVYVIPHRAGPTYDRRKFVTMALIEDVKNLGTGAPLKMEISRQYAGFMSGSK